MTPSETGGAGITDTGSADIWDKTIEEELVAQLRHEANIFRDQYHRGEINSDTSHLDGETLPGNMYLTFESGPEFTDDHAPPPLGHIDTAIQLLETRGYDALIQYFDGHTPGRAAADGGEPPTAYAWFHSEGQDRQPIIDDLGLGKLFYLFRTRDDANRFMKEYCQHYGITDLSPYERVEVEITEVVAGEDIEDAVLTPEILREINSQDEGDKQEKSEQVDFEKY